MKFDELLYQSLTTTSLEIKEEKLMLCLKHCTENTIEYSENFAPTDFLSPSYASLCAIVSPRDLHERKDFESIEGLGVMVHAIAHIEYSAIDLAFDAVYRYPDMPVDFKIDWLVVAQDEIRHFKMLEALLGELGYRYGDFPVHSGLFDVSRRCGGSVLERMAVVPRYYEAAGLDVNPKIIAKLQNKAKNPHIKTLIGHLEVILAEEIVHVQKGNRWFGYACGESRVVDGEQTYMDILEKYDLINRPRPHINVEARREAGFSCSELIKLGAKSCK